MLAAHSLLPMPGVPEGLKLTATLIALNFTTVYITVVELLAWLATKLNLNHP